MVSSDSISVADAFAWLVHWLDDSNLFVMALIALFLRLMAVKLRGQLHWRPAARFLSAFFLIVYLLHLSNTIDWFEDFAGVVGLLLRISLATYLFYVCVAVPLIFLTHLSVRYLQSEITVLQKVAKELADQRAARLKENPDASISIPTSREETMRRNARQAKLDYEFECDLLKRANLEEDELEYALAEAKQKYMHRLRNAIL